MIRIPQRTAFYPGDLRRQVARALEAWIVPRDLPRLRGGVVPHAGWRYSGRVAARTFKALAERTSAETIVFLGTAHRPDVDRPSVYPEGAWETPVGTVEVDGERARRLLEELGERAVASTRAHDEDHCLEVQMPFVRLLLPDARVIPIAMPHVEGAPGFGLQLGELFSEEKGVIFVASSDLTHYGGPYGFAPAGTGPAAETWLEENDRRLLALIESLDAEAIVPEASRHSNACGAAAIAAVVAAARHQGSERGVLIEYTHSHRESPQGPFEMAVGYGGLVF